MLTCFRTVDSSIAEASGELWRAVFWGYDSLRHVDFLCRPHGKLVCLWKSVMGTSGWQKFNGFRRDKVALKDKAAIPSEMFRGVKMNWSDF